MGTYLSRLASANAGGIYLTRQGKSREGEDLNLGEDSPIIFQADEFLEKSSEICSEIHLDVSECVWTLSK